MPDHVTPSQVCSFSDQWEVSNVSPRPIRGPGLSSVYISQEPLSDSGPISGSEKEGGDWTVVSPVSVQARFSKVYGWSIKLLSEKDCSFIRKKSPSDIIASSESDHFWKKLNKLVCFVKVEIIRKNLKVCFSFCLNPKLPSLPRLLESVLSISVLHLQGSLNLFLNALNSLDNNAFLWDYAQTRQ